MKNKAIERNIQLRAVTDDLVENRQAEFVISSEAVDSYGTVFRKPAWQLDSYLKNPLVTYNHSLHSTDPDSIIGTSEVFFDGEELIGRVTFEEADVNPLAEKVLRKVQAGTLKMASVGAIVKKAHWGEKKNGEDEAILYFDEVELVEWSVVPAGANPDAHKRNREAVDALKAELSKEIVVEAEPVVVNQRSVIEAQLIINKSKYENQ